MEPKVKSAGHLCFIGHYEYMLFDDDQVYRAPCYPELSHYGYRIGYWYMSATRWNVLHAGSKTDAVIPACH